MSRAPRRMLAIAMTALAIGLVAVQSTSMSAAPAAQAYWTSNSASGGAGAASGASLGPGSTPTVAVQNRTGVTVTWAASSLPNGPAATGYTVSRLSATGVVQSIGNGCSGVVTALTCTETAIPDGQWTYTVTPRYQNWVGTASAASSLVRTDGTAPVNNLSLVNVNGAWLTGSTVFYRGSTGGSFSVRNTLTDTNGSGSASSSTGLLTGTSTGFTHTASAVTTPNGGPFTSNPFTWSAGTTSTPTVGISGNDVYGNTAASVLSFVLDDTLPTGGAISYTGGSTNATSISITLGSIADTGSGLAGGIYQLQRRIAPLTGSTCGEFGEWDIVRGDVPFAGSVENVPLTAGQCTRYRTVFYDSVGNRALVTSPSNNDVKAKSYNAAVTGTSGLTSYYLLDDTGSITSDSVGRNTGTRTGGSAAASAITGDTGSSRVYNGVSDFNRVPSTISGNFTIEFWFRSSQNVGSGSQWYNGAGLVDAEVSGSQNDFGISLLGGRVAAGTGNPDLSVISGAAYNDNQWHHVAMTRVQSGVVTLYVDGTAQGTVATNAAALTASANLDFGRLQTGIGYYAGSLDQVALYNRALTDTEVNSHYQAGSAN